MTENITIEDRDKVYHISGSSIEITRLSTQKYKWTIIAGFREPFTDDKNRRKLLDAIYSTNAELHERYGAIGMKTKNKPIGANKE